MDHNHYDGKVRGLAHNNCNLHLHVQDVKIPVFFHNLKSYDGHFIIKELGTYIKQFEYDEKLSLINKPHCIADNSEKIKQITWKNVVF